MWIFPTKRIPVENSHWNDFPHAKLMWENHILWIFFTLTWGVRKSIQCRFSIGSVWWEISTFIQWFIFEGVYPYSQFQVVSNCKNLGYTSYCILWICKGKLLQERARFSQYWWSELQKSIVLDNIQHIHNTAYTHSGTTIVPYLCSLCFDF